MWFLKDLETFCSKENLKGSLGKTTISQRLISIGVSIPLYTQEEISLAIKIISVARRALLTTCVYASYEKTITGPSMATKYWYVNRDVLGEETALLSDRVNIQQAMFAVPVFEKIRFVSKKF